MKYRAIRGDLCTGDLLFVSSTSLAARVIQGVSHSRWNHVGVVVRAGVGDGTPELCDYDMLLLLESTLGHADEEVRDIFTGGVVRGVRLVPLSQRMADEARHGKVKFAFRRLFPGLGTSHLAAFDQWRHGLMGRPYEQNWLELLKAAWDGPFGQNREALQSVFCSELAASLLIHLGILKADANPSNEYTPGDLAEDPREGRDATLPLAGHWLYESLQLVEPD